MKSNLNSYHNSLSDPGRNPGNSGSQLQQIAKGNRLTDNIHEHKIRLVYSAKQASEKTDKLEKTKLYIKNMVSIRCKMVVRAVLENLGLNYSFVELGEIEIIGDLSNTKHGQLKADLLKYGLELMEDKKNILVEKIKNVIVEMIHYSDELPDVKFSNYLGKKLNHHYTYLANLFSEVKGMSIQHFVMLHKTERVKELLMYDEFTLSEIAWKLHYSSVAHLSNQFKKITGLTPTHFKNMKYKRRTALDNV
jgi:AraC-like DNA-binding protein